MGIVHRLRQRQATQQFHRKRIIRTIPPGGN
jgi:hypothetical protein